jgi:3-deoxy-D-manno-octulosonic-acid transferase
MKVFLIRLLYTALMYAATPVILWRLMYRGIRSRAYFKRWLERFGRFPDPGLEGSIWVHAVSVGEFNAAMPLIEHFLKSDRPVVVTTITPTGSERVRKVFGDRVFHVYLPYDLPGPIRRFLARVRPQLALIMETEIWPNLFLTLKARRIPVVIANGRLSERSVRGYGPALPLITAALKACTWIAAQSQTDAERFLRLGARAEQLSVAGNIKFDMQVASDADAQGRELRLSWGAERPAWLAASTHDPEEVHMLDAHARVLGRFPDAVLLIAPRHPERFKAVIQLCKSYGFRTQSRTEHKLPDVSAQVFVIDTLGELMKFFAAVDIAFVAGSFAPIGGHNVLEPAALGKPVIVGPQTHNFEEITDQLIKAGAALRVQSGSELGGEVLKLFGNPNRMQAIGAEALALVTRERGAVARILGKLEELALLTR